MPTIDETLLERIKSAPPDSGERFRTRKAAFIETAMSILEDSP